MRRALLPLLLLLPALAPAAAHAAVGFGPAHRIGAYDSPALALDVGPRGRTLAVWGAGDRLRVANARAGRLPRHDRALRGSRGAEGAWAARTADGTELVAWRYYDHTSPPTHYGESCCHGVRATVRRPGHRFARPRTLVPKRTEVQPDLHVAVGRHGHAAVALRTQDARMMVASTRHGRLRRARVVPASEGHFPDPVSVAYVHGRLHVTYVLQQDDGAVLRQIVQRRDGRFGRPRDLLGGALPLTSSCVRHNGFGDIAPLEVHTAPNGAQVALWAEADGAAARLVAATRAPGHRFHTTALARYPNALWCGARLASARNGAAVVLLTDPQGRQGVSWIARRHARHGFGAPAPLTGVDVYPGISGLPWAVDGRGNAALLYPVGQPAVSAELLLRGTHASVARRFSSFLGGGVLALDARGRGLALIGDRGRLYAARVSTR